MTEVLFHFDADVAQEMRQRIFDLAAERGMDSAVMMWLLAQIAGQIAAMQDRVVYQRQPFDKRMQAFFDVAFETYERAGRQLSEQPKRVVTRDVAF